MILEISLVLAALAGFLLFLIETRKRTRLSKKISTLNEEPQGFATTVVRNEEKKVAVSQLQKGDVIKIAAGEKVPASIELLTGSTRVDLSFYTGSKTLVHKKKGDFLEEGSVNCDATITGLVTGHKNAYLNLRKSFLSKLKVSLIPWVLWLGVLLGLTAAGLVLKQKPFILEASLALGVLLLVFGNLLLSSQTKKAGWKINCLSLGIFPENEKSFDKVSKISSLFFNKTGTLTKGEFYYSQIFLERDVNCGQMLSYIFSIEEKSSHPLAKAVKTHPWYDEIAKGVAREVVEHEGLGISGFVKTSGFKETFVVIGNIRFLKRNKMYITRAIREKVEQIEGLGETAILCGFEGEARGLLSFADTCRLQTKEFLDEMKKLEIKTTLITGDHELMLSHLGNLSRINLVYTRCIAEEKIQKMRKKKDEGQKVAFLGAWDEKTEIFNEASLALCFALNPETPKPKADFYFLNPELKTVSYLLSKGKI